MTKRHHTVRFVVGERPEALIWQFADADGVPIVLDADATVTVRMAGRTGVMREETGSVEDAATGRVRYDWIGDELTKPGTVFLNFWVETGGMRLASNTIDVRVYEPEGGTPAVVTP